MSPNDSYSQHVVTAVIVAHDGAAWLSAVADALAGQTRPVQRVVAVDTGSRDRGGSVLAAKFGQASVFGMDRSTGYGTAIARALKHRAATVPLPPARGVAEEDLTEWIWLLHDDSEPAPDALAQLLRGAAEAPAAGVLGPKVKDWANRDVILEAGITLDGCARRITGIEPREVDQGQHDGDRDSLAVSSAGMLIRRDVWDDVGGFDPSMRLFMEDIDFCWRVHAAGYRVMVITDAVVYHMQASARHRRPVSVGRRARMLDRRNGLIALLGNLPAGKALKAAIGNVLLSLARIGFFLIAKRLIAALDETAALTAVLGHPLRLLGARRRRSYGRKSAYARVKGDLRSGRTWRRLSEFFAVTFLRTERPEEMGAHHASADPGADDSMLQDDGLARRLLTSPSVLTFAGLTVVALVAAQRLLGSGPPGGGELLPVWGGASDLWRTYWQAFHPSGIGSSAAAPPYLALIALLATVLGGKPWLAFDVILVGCVPLAGMTAMFAARRVTRSPWVLVWVAVSYALLPVATGAIAAGRFGSAVAYVLLPLIVLAAGRVVTADRQQARRAAWAATLLITVGMAFVPALWLMDLGAAAFTALVFWGIRFRGIRASGGGKGVKAHRGGTRAVLTHLLIIAVAPPILLFPWSMGLLTRPGQLVLEAGLNRPGLSPANQPARSLILLSPGGPGLPPSWITAGLLAAAVAALFAGRRRRLIVAGWGLALAGLLCAIVVSGVSVGQPGGGAIPAWPGVPMAVAALGLLLAAAAGADGLRRLLAGRKGLRALTSWAGAWTVTVGLVAASAPVLALAYWAGGGMNGPVRPIATSLVPELIASQDGLARQVRTLVLSSAGGHVSYLLLRGPNPSLADVFAASPGPADQALATTVASLLAPAGGTAANQVRQLAGMDIGYVLVESPVDPQVAGVLDSVAGLRPYSTTDSYSLWTLQQAPARVTVVEPNGTVVAIPSGPVSVSGAAAPAAGGTLVLAEPAGAWTASLDGRALTAVPSPSGSWGQAFRLPAGGGKISIGYGGLGHYILLILQALAFLVVAALALPGIRSLEMPGEARAAKAPEEAAAGTSGDGEEMAAAGQSGDAEPVGAPRTAGAGARAGLAEPATVSAGAGGDAGEDEDEVADRSSRGRHGLGGRVPGGRRLSGRRASDGPDGAARSRPPAGSPAAGGLPGQDRQPGWPYQEADQRGGPADRPGAWRSPSGRTQPGGSPAGGPSAGQPAAAPSPSGAWPYPDAPAASAGRGGAHEAGIPVPAPAYQEGPVNPEPPPYREGGTRRWPIPGAGARPARGVPDQAGRSGSAADRGAGPRGSSGAGLPRSGAPGPRTPPAGTPLPGGAAAARTTQWDPRGRSRADPEPGAVGWDSRAKGTEPSHDTRPRHGGGPRQGAEPPYGTSRVPGSGLTGAAGEHASPGDPNRGPRSGRRPDPDFGSGPGYGTGPGFGTGPGYSTGSGRGASARYGDEAPRAMGSEHEDGLDHPDDPARRGPGAGRATRRRPAAGGPAEDPRQTGERSRRGGAWIRPADIPDQRDPEAEPEYDGGSW